MAVETSRSVALVLAPHPRGGRAVRIGAAGALALGAASTSLVLPVGAAIVVGLFGLAVMLGACVSRERLRAGFAARAARRAHAARRRARERALDGSGFGAGEALAELAGLVDGIVANAPEIAARLELEDLLDRHVTLALARERAVRAAAMFDRGQLELARDACFADPSIDRRRLELCERRLRTQEQCEARVHQLGNELSLIADLIRLIAQRVAYPEEPALDDRIERYLVEMDEQDAACEQLADDLL